MNAPINLYFDVNTAEEISELVDSDSSKYDGFAESLTYIFYPAYNLVETLVLIIYVVPSILLPLVISLYFTLKLKSSLKPIDKVKEEIEELDEGPAGILSEYVNGLPVIQANSKQLHYAQKLTKLYD